MKSNITLVPTTGMSHEDWLGYRKDGIGASESGIIMGLSPYKASIQLFYEKIGQDLGFNVENISMFLGKEQEPFLATLWEYWPYKHTGDFKEAQALMMQNYRQGNKERRCKRVNAYATNSKWPWLFVSLDREINKYDNRDNGALELKTIGGYEVDKWEAGLPPVYMIQVNQQMLVCEYDYGEIAVLRDNRDYYVLPFERSEVICESIISTTKAFWDKVTEGKKIITRRFEAERNFNYSMVQELDAQLQMLEPEPDGSDAFHAFLKEKYQIALPGERPGTPQQLEDAKQHKDINSRIKELQEAKQLHENRLKNDLGQLGADRLDFGADGYVSWKSDTNGVRRFLNKVK
jgi:putative phage-type endonuclease